MNEVIALEDAHDVAKFGGKAVNLGKMLRAKLTVPDGFAVSVNAFDKSGKLNADAKDNIKRKLDKDKQYAVRSSATVEDASNASWAGQFESYLNVNAHDVFVKIEECHNSVKARAKTYADNADSATVFNIAVVVQKMLNPILAGVLFTENPIGSPDEIIIEYVEGLGESLVQGEADPFSIIWNKSKKIIIQSSQEPPFSVENIVKIAGKVEKEFGAPQDIEWALADDKLWLVQTRPITTGGDSSPSYYLGAPDDLFYWGPSRADPLYMSDFIVAEEQNFARMHKDPTFPNPPETLILFAQNQMVWLNNAKAFDYFVRRTFLSYQKYGQLSKDFQDWKDASAKADQFSSKPEVFDLLLHAWITTLIPEFALYGAESVIIDQLARFDQKQRHRIWETFTLPDQPTFLQRIDEELKISDQPSELANKYPWMQDGYHGTRQDASTYFTDRFKSVKENKPTAIGSAKERTKLTKEIGLRDKEIQALDLARELAKFMDERKAWMMKTRHYLTNITANTWPKHGWHYRDGHSQQLDSKTTNELWKRYIDFKSSNSKVTGIVVSTGGKDFTEGIVKIASSPNDAVPDDRILVVPSTSPSYVPLMRKARALVTDHGGMMSHAAIVAREFGLPCIVGTKQATKVLKDGDNVVLDLVKGEVNL